MDIKDKLVSIHQIKTLTDKTNKRLDSVESNVSDLQDTDEHPNLLFLNKDNTFNAIVDYSLPDKKTVFFINKDDDQLIGDFIPTIYNDSDGCSYNEFMTIDENEASYIVHCNREDAFANIKIVANRLTGAAITSKYDSNKDSKVHSQIQSNASSSGTLVLANATKQGYDKAAGSAALDVAEDNSSMSVSVYNTKSTTGRQVSINARENIASINLNRIEVSTTANGKELSKIKNIVTEAALGIEQDTTNAYLQLNAKNMYTFVDDNEFEAYFNN